MNNQSNKIVAFLRIGFGLVVVTALGAQISLAIQQERNLVNFFSFFTIESNALAAIVLLVSGVGVLAGKKTTQEFAMLRGAVTLYMVITGIVFALLLSGLEQRLQLTIPWVNMVLHQLIPTVMLLDWVLFPPKVTLTFSRVLLWLIFPIAYLIYTLMRGSFVDWYPYPFLDPPQVGWPYVIVTSIVIAIGAIGLAWMLALRTRVPSKNR